MKAVLKAVNRILNNEEERKSYQEDRIMESTQLERQHKYRLKNKSNIRVTAAMKLKDSYSLEEKLSST